MKEDVKDRIGITNEREKNAYKVLIGKFERGINSEVLVVDGSIILKLT